MQGYEWLINLGEKLLAAIGVIATFVFGLVYRHERQIQAKLKAHKEHLELNDTEIGLCKAQRLQVAEGPFGRELNETIRSIDEQLDELRGVDAEVEEMIRNEVRVREVAEAEFKGRLLAIEKVGEERFNRIMESLARIEKK